MLDLESIKARWARLADDPNDPWPIRAARTDIQALVAEVERLRAAMTEVEYKLQLTARGDPSAWNDARIIVCKALEGGG